MTSLGLLQVANFLIPLLVIPVITRALGVEAFGKVSYAQNIITYLTLLVNYGFEFSATRQIAIASDKAQQKRIFWSVIYCKILLLIVSFAVLGILLVSVDKIGSDARLYIYTALINIGVVFFPTWYLQGIQDMQKMAWINFAIKVVGAIFVVSLVHQANQYRLYPLILSLSSIAIGIGAFVYVVKHYELGSSEGCVGLKEVLAPGGMIFLNQLFVSLYTTVNLTLLGCYLSNSDLGIFSGAQRIILAANACLVVPVSTAFFPEISKQQVENAATARQLFKRLLVGGGAISLIASFTIYALAPWIVGILLGEGFEASVLPLRMMAPLPCLVMVATILTVQGLYGRGLQRYAPIVGSVLAFICIGLNVVLIPQLGMTGSIVAWISAEVCEIIFVGGILLHHRRCSI